MVDALYFSAPVGSNDSTPAVKKNLVDSCHFVGYADQADLANIPAFLRTTIGASAYTLDNKLWFLTATAGSGTWTEFTGGGTFTAGGDLSGNATSQAVIAATGAAGTLPLATTAAIIQWAAASVAPKLKQADVTTNGATGAKLTVQAQHATGTTATGGALALTSGTGTTAAGSVTIETGGTARVTVSPTAITQALPVTINSATANSVAETWQTNSVTRARVGYDGTYSYFEGGPTASVAASGAFRAGQDTIALALQSHAGATTGAYSHVYQSGEDFVYINKSYPGVTSAQNLWLECSSTIAMNRNGGPMAYFTPSGDGFFLFTNHTFYGTNPTIRVNTPGGDVDPKDLIITGSSGSSGSTTPAHKSAGQVIVNSGTAATADGRERGLSARLLTAVMIEVGQIQPTNTYQSEAIVLCGGSDITTTVAPTNSGRNGVWLGPATALPSVLPGTIGWTSWFGDATNDGFLINSHSGATVRLGRTNEAFQVEAASGTASFSVSSAGAARTHSTRVNIGKVRTVATNGGSITIAQTTALQIIDPAALIAGYTVTMPATPVDGQEVEISVGAQGVTTITHSPNSGQTLNSGLTGTVINAYGKWTYVTAVTTWFRTA